MVHKTTFLHQFNILFLFKEKSKKYITISIAAFICYCNTLWGSFVFDDTEAIVKNKDVMPYIPLNEIFRNDFWGSNISLNSSHKSYRPLTILSYRYVTTTLCTKN